MTAPSFEQQLAPSGIGAPESGGARHAALLLHAMAATDRAWMLNALPVAQRDELRALLAELEALGIARDPALIANATDDATPHALSGTRANDASPRDVPLSDEDMLHALDPHQVLVLIRCMRAEPASLIAQLLGMAPWPWREQLLGGLEPIHRRRVEELMSASTGATAPAALRSALIAAASLHARAQATAPDPVGWRASRGLAQAASPWSRLRAWTKRSVGA